MNRTVWESRTNLSETMMLMCMGWMRGVGCLTAMRVVMGGEKG